MYRATIEKISRYLTNIFASGAAVSMFAVFGIIFYNSVRRYAFGKSFEWGEELPVFIAVYGFMFGAAYAYMQDRHVRFTVLVGFLSRSMTEKLYLLVDLIMVVVGGVLTFSGWQFVVKRGGIETSGLIGVAKDISAATGIDWTVYIGYFYPYQFAMVLGGAMLTVAALCKFLKRGAEKSWLIDESDLQSLEN